MTQSNSPVDAPAAAARAAHHHPHHRAAHAKGAFAHQLRHAATADTANALRTAMAKEAVPQSWESGLRFIMEHESNGKVGARNTVDTARGLFQLTAVNYHLNPHGAGSFGDAVEEAQGGIRYIEQRYQTADNAAAFWQRHRWY